ncbi:MAG: WYL domain-containing protein [Alistipes sp.]|nr:WYL domain-containing protein [Alistipes sp.]
MKQNSESKFKMRVRVKDANVESMRSMPLHSSQCEVERTDKYTDFEYFVAPTSELYNRLLSYGSGVEVLEPKEARLGMKNRIMNMSFMYSEEMARTKIGKAVIYATNKFPKANIARVRHSLEMQRGIDYIRRLDACMLYLEATCGSDYVKTFRLDDPEVLATFQRGDTEGVYMCSSEEVRAKLREAEIGSIDDIVELNRNHHHPKTQPWPYDHSLVQTLISYFGVYVKCHHPEEYEIFMSGLNN